MDKVLMQKQIAAAILGQDQLVFTYKKDKVDAVTGKTDTRIVVRYGTKTGPTKGRKLRTIPLPAPAVEAALAWLEALPEYATRNPLGLAFPGRLGAHRGDGPPKQWTTWLRTAGITRRVRWHDLRHTCGASLISGWWGRAWRLEEVRDYLGHTQTRMTERYAHLGATALREAAFGTPGLVPVHPQTGGEMTASPCLARASESPLDLAENVGPEGSPGTGLGHDFADATTDRLRKALRSFSETFGWAESWDVAEGGRR